jgi:5'-3' exonuclease
MRKLATDFAGKKIAVDANNILYVLMAISHKKVVERTNFAVDELDRSEVLKKWMSDILTFIIEWMSHGATLIFVFDGKHPDEKDQTKIKRREERQKLIDKSTDLKTYINSLPIMERTPDILKEYQKSLIRCAGIHPEEMQYFQALLSGLGIPCIQSYCDAEKVCTMLCREGKVDAVYSGDSDNLAMGCPLLITEFSTEKYQDPNTGNLYKQVEVVRYDDVLKGLGFTSKKFIDCCIMFGCDFNANIPQVGTKRVIKLFEKFESIDALPRLAENPINLDPAQCGLPKTRTYDTTVLNHERCREIFLPVPSESLILSGNFELQDILNETGRPILSQFGLIDYIIKLVPVYRSILSKNYLIPAPPRKVKIVINKPK